jgi:predicted Zn-dependent protease
LNPVIDNFEKMLAAGQDSALLRYSLGNAHLDEAPQKAIVHLEKAVLLDAKYSAAWKLLGKARASIEDTKGAIDAFETGIAVAEANGDVQAMKEMRVFLKRLNK